MAVKITQMGGNPSVIISNNGGARWSITAKCNACGHTEAATGTGNLQVTNCPKCGSSSVTMLDVRIGG